MFTHTYFLFFCLCIYIFTHICLYIHKVTYTESAYRLGAMLRTWIFLFGCFCIWIFIQMNRGGVQIGRHVFFCWFPARVGRLHWALSIWRLYSRCTYISVRYIYIHTYIYVYIITHTHIYIHIYICVFACAHMCTHVYIYIYVHIYAGPPIGVLPMGWLRLVGSLKV